jgi:hypothetical protein
MCVHAIHCLGLTLSIITMMKSKSITSLICSYILSILWTSVDYVYIKSIMWTSSNYVYFCSGLFGFKVINDDGLVYFESIGQV